MSGEWIMISQYQNAFYKIFPKLEAPSFIFLVRILYYLSTSHLHHPIQIGEKNDKSPFGGLNCDLHLPDVQNVGQINLSPSLPNENLQIASKM